MSQLSFSNVPMMGFSSYYSDLASGSWNAIDVSGYEGPGGTSLWAASPLVMVKMRLKREVSQLLQSIEGAGGAKGCDRAWDSCQKQLCGLLGVAAESNDLAKREAANRLQKMLLLGAGMGQTRLKYQEEVDYGRKQVALVSQGQAAADVALLGLGAMLGDIALATEALALAIDHGHSVHTPHRRKVKATLACVATFEWAATTLTWLVENAGAGTERDLATQLLGSLEELVARYPVVTESAGRATAAPPSA